MIPFYYGPSSAKIRNEITVPIPVPPRHKVTVPTVPVQVPFPQHWNRLLTWVTWVKVSRTPGRGVVDTYGR